jgi:AraC-like DNA-binding protein
LRSWAAAVEPVGPRWSVYREFPPVPEVAAAVACTWHGRAGWARTLRILPDGCVDLVWDGRGLTVVATAGEPLRWWLPATARTTGARLRCGGAGTVLGQRMSELPPGATPLAQLWGEPARRAEELLASDPSPTAQRRVLESLVAGRLRAGFEPSRLALEAVRELGSSGARIAHLADRVGTSERSLRRWLRDEVGYGPKQMHRIIRFHRFLRRVPRLALGRTSLADVAAELGYADQSHLGRECRRFAGSAPGAVIRSWARQDALAEMFQTSPTPDRRIEPATPTQHRSNP